MAYKFKKLSSVDTVEPSELDTLLGVNTETNRVIQTNLTSVLEPLDLQESTFRNSGLTKDQLKAIQTAAATGTTIPEITITNTADYIKVYDFHGCKINKLTVIGWNIHIKNAEIKSTVQIGDDNTRTFNNFFTDVVFYPRKWDTDISDYDWSPENLLPIRFARLTWGTVFTRCKFKGQPHYQIKNPDGDIEIQNIDLTDDQREAGYTSIGPIARVGTTCIEQVSYRRGNTITFNQCHFYGYESVLTYKCTTEPNDEHAFGGVMIGGYLDCCDYIINAESDGTIDFEMTAVDTEVMKSILHDVADFGGEYPALIANITYNAGYSGKFTDSLINVHSGTCNCFVGGASLVTGNSGLVFNSICPVNTCYTNVPGQSYISYPVTAVPNLYRLRYSLAPGETYIPLDDITITVGPVRDLTKTDANGNLLNTRNAITSNIQIMASPDVDVYFMTAPSLQLSDITDVTLGTPVCHNLKNIKPLLDGFYSLGRGRLILKNNNTDNRTQVILDIPSFCRLRPSAYNPATDLYKYNTETNEVEKVQSSS